MRWPDTDTGNSSHVSLPHDVHSLVSLVENICPSPTATEQTERRAWLLFLQPQHNLNDALGWCKFIIPSLIHAHAFKGL